MSGGGCNPRLQHWMPLHPPHWSFNILLLQLGCELVLSSWIIKQQPVNQQQKNILELTHQNVMSVLFTPALFLLWHSKIVKRICVLGIWLSYILDKALFCSVWNRIREKLHLCHNPNPNLMFYADNFVLQLTISSLLIDFLECFSWYIIRLIHEMSENKTISVQIWIWIERYLI